MDEKQIDDSISGLISKADSETQGSISYRISLSSYDFTFPEVTDGVQYNFFDNGLEIIDVPVVGTNFRFYFNEREISNPVRTPYIM